MVAGTVGLVEALKDQGFARWNHNIRTIHHHAKSNFRSTKNLSSSSRGKEEKAKQSEESLRKISYERLNIYEDTMTDDIDCLKKEGLEESFEIEREKYDEVRGMDGGRNSSIGGGTQRSRLCTVELHNQSHPPPRQVRSPVTYPDKEIVFSGGRGFNRKQG
ncbi:hypothetical protein E3N88_31233 [Mikania micrantha]|uniref:Uncharacterized protein n=1 Tax=Mikania micrantha TaxID=192012 RepID=A0A5N6MPR1_9ASTR|nr:hypothetical protein E3N88_31233 [Mikania micrantha]